MSRMVLFYAQVVPIPFPTTQHWIGGKGGCKVIQAQLSDMVLFFAKHGPQDRSRTSRNLACTPYLFHMVGMQGTQHTGLLASTHRTHLGGRGRRPSDWTCTYWMDSLDRPCCISHMFPTWWACKGLSIAVYWSILVPHLSLIHICRSRRY